jgi:O-succinylbenzoic acid--CoA ligase
MIDWRSRETHLFINPKLPSAIKDRMKIHNLPLLHGHIWLSSSGTTTTSTVSLYALSKKAFLVAAEAANWHLKATPRDVWLNVLPAFHVGGLAIWARSHLANQKVIDQSAARWDVAAFFRWCDEGGVTLASLVPTQLFDLVESGRRAPSSLRAILLGGAATDETLYRRARELGFNVLPSYGMTECCSQVATAPLESLQRMDFPEMRVLPHIEVKNDSEGFLAIQSEALFTMRVDCHPQHYENLKRVGDWYVTKDRADLRTEGESQVWLRPRGRSNDELKISGELVNLLDLNGLFYRISGLSEAVILAQKNERRGHDIVVVLPRESYEVSGQWIEKFNREVVPVAKIMATYFVDKIPRTELGKVKTADLRARLGLT